MSCEFYQHVTTIPLRHVHMWSSLSAACTNHVTPKHTTLRIHAVCMQQTEDTLRAELTKRTETILSMQQQLTQQTEHIGVVQQERSQLLDEVQVSRQGLQAYVPTGLRWALRCRLFDRSHSAVSCTAEAPEGGAAVSTSIFCWYGACNSSLEQPTDCHNSRAQGHSISR